VTIRPHAVPSRNVRAKTCGLGRALRGDPACADDHNCAGAPCETVPGALRAARIEDFRFHDLRHTFASRLAMAGVERLVSRESKPTVTAASGNGVSTVISTKLLPRRRCALQLVGKVGEPWWDRTTDPLIKSQVLCQLS
jgi:hypothetical protein